MVRWLALAFLLLVMSLAGCASAKGKNHQAESFLGNEQDDPAMRMLQEAAQDIHRDLQQLVRIESTRLSARKHMLHAYATPHRGALAKQITLNWSGPLAPAVQALADMIGYKFSVIGTAPVAPILITVDVLDEPAFEVLSDMGWQAGDRVGVCVNDRAREIQVIYVGDDS